jgi:CheY-like chemotaxis protein
LWVRPIAGGPVARQNSLSGGRILIVDDSPHFRAVAAALLAARGFEQVGDAVDGSRR